MKDILAESIQGEANDAGIAAVSVVNRRTTERCSVWVPDLARGPRFLIYSITKTFTAVLILRLCEEGKLDLAERIAKWFPTVPGAERIDVRQLLNHTSGIRDYGGLAAYDLELRRSPTRPWSFDRFAAETFARGLLFEPGNGWSYSNPGYMLLNGIAEQVGGGSYKTLIASHVADPLGLRDTAVVESLDDMAPLAAGTSCSLSPDGGALDVRTHYHPGWVSHGVIASTCTDVARFFDALFGGELLSRAGVSAMLELIPLGKSTPAESNALPLRTTSPGYGLGLMGDPDSPWGLLVGHNGGGPCYQASAFHAMTSGVSVCVMTAIERGFSTESMVAETLDSILQRR